MQRLFGSTPDLNVELILELCIDARLDTVPEYQACCEGDRALQGDNTFVFILHPINSHALVGQAANECRAEHDIVFDQQHAHVVGLRYKNEY